MKVSKIVNNGHLLPMFFEKKPVVTVVSPKYDFQYKNNFYPAILIKLTTDIQRKPL